MTLFEEERPVAALQAMIANQNRDVKKKKEPWTLDQFCLYKPREAEDLPKYVFGSAALVALQRGLFPNWALFCYKSLASAANDDYKPRISILVSEDAILLHPTKSADGYSGMLVAAESCANQLRTMTDDEGNIVQLRMPPIPTKYIAEENVHLGFS